MTRSKTRQVTIKRAQEMQLEDMSELMDPMTQNPVDEVKPHILDLDVDDLYSTQAAKEIATQQHASEASRGLEASAPATIRAAGTTFAAKAAEVRHQTFSAGQLATARLKECQLIADLSPYASRGSTLKHKLLTTGLILGETGSAYGAALFLGNTDASALALALGVGAAAAGLGQIGELAGKERWKHERQADLEEDDRRRARALADEQAREHRVPKETGVGTNVDGGGAAGGPPAPPASVTGPPPEDAQTNDSEGLTLPQLKERYPNLFRTVPMSKFVQGFAILMIAAFALGVGMLRSAVDGDAFIGAAYTMISFFLVGASVISHYRYADVAADLIEAARARVKRHEKIEAKLAKDRDVVEHEESKVEGDIIRAAYAEEGKAGAAIAEAANFHLLARSPGVVGHGANVNAGREEEPHDEVDEVDGHDVADDVTFVLYDEELKPESAADAGAPA